MPFDCACLHRKINHTANACSNLKIKDMRPKRKKNNYPDVWHQPNDYALSKLNHLISTIGQKQGISVTNKD